MIRFIALGTPTPDNPEIVYDVRRETGESLGKLLATPELAEAIRACIDLATVVYAAAHYGEPA